MLLSAGGGKETAGKRVNINSGVRHQTTIETPLRMPSSCWPEFGVVVVCFVLC